MFATRWWEVAGALVEPELNELGVIRGDPRQPLLFVLRHHRRDDQRTDIHDHTMNFRTSSRFQEDVQ